jgi:hypothetical protein
MDQLSPEGVAYLPGIAQIPITALSLYTKWKVRMKRMDNNI